MKLDETSSTEFFAQYGSDSLLVNHNGRVYDLKVWLSQAKFDTTISKALLAIKKKMSDLVKKGKIAAGVTMEDFIRKSFSLSTTTPDVFVRDGTTPYGGNGSGYATFDNKELGKTLMEKEEKVNNKIKESGPNSYEPLSTIKFWPKGAGLYEVYINGVNAGLFDEDDYEKLHSLEARFLEGLKKLLEPTMNSRRSMKEARSGTIKVIAPSGNSFTYTRKEIKEMIDHYYDTYECADNLPKWIWVSAYYHNAENVRNFLRKYKGNKNEKVIQFLNDLLICKRATINLDLSGSNSFNQAIDIEM
jgi:hypothetical protein